MLVEYSTARGFRSEVDMFVAQAVLQFLCLKNKNSALLAVFTVLCEQYQPSLRRDPMYNEYLDRIGQLFFGVPPKQTSSYGGLL
ncbi:UNVERIFIED_CONTAM: hypothetical protein FQV15_0001045, partial [Eudyptes pachyrhynchus]